MKIVLLYNLSDIKVLKFCRQSGIKSLLEIAKLKNNVFEKFSCERNRI